MTDNQIVIDQEQVSNIKMAFNEGFNDFIETYFQDFEKKYKELSSAVQDKNLETVVKIAHALKGTSLNVGAQGLGNKCAELEEAGKTGNFAEVQQGYQDLQQFFPTYKTAFIKLTAQI